MRKGCKRIVSVSGFLGSLLVAIGLLANPWMLSHILGVGTITLQVKIFVVIFDVFLVISGLLVFFKGNTPTGRKHLAFSFIAVLLAIMTIEGALHIIDAAIEGGTTEPGVSRPRYLSSAYEGQEWAETYFNRYFQLKSDYEPFIGWDRREYQSEYINIDSQGVRKTWNPEHHSGEIPSTIYVFGGSTLWGCGSRDDYTIPSHLSRLLYDGGYNFTVYNYGEGAYTFTQEIVQLLLLLREGHEPDYVVFYDGINEVFTAYQSDVPGATFNLNKTRETLGKASPSSPRIIYETVITILERHSMIYRLLGNIADVDPLAVSRRSDEDLRLLSIGTAEYYLRSLELLDHLADAYNFEYACFWQPVSCMESELISDEVINAYTTESPICRVCQMTYDYLMASSPPHFFDITDSLSGRGKAYYIDWAHISEEGNEAVATTVFEIFEDLFLQE